MTIDLGYRDGTNDFAYLKMLETVEQSTKDPATKELATKLKEGWNLFQRKNGDAGVYSTRLRLRKLITPDNDVLSSPRFTVYYEYVRKHTPIAKDFHKTVARDLKECFGQDFFAFLAMLENCTKNPATMNLATLLHDNMYHFWANLLSTC